MITIAVDLTQDQVNYILRKAYHDFLIGKQYKLADKEERTLRFQNFKQMFDDAGFNTAVDIDSIPDQFN